MTTTICIIAGLIAVLAVGTLSMLIATIRHYGA